MALILAVVLDHLTTMPNVKLESTTKHREISEWPLDVPILCKFENWKKFREGVLERALVAKDTYVYRFWFTERNGNRTFRQILGRDCDFEEI